MPSQAKVRLGRNIPSKLIQRNCFTFYFEGGQVSAKFSRLDPGRFNKSRNAAPARVARAFLLLGGGSMEAGGAAREPHC